VRYAKRRVYRRDVPGRAPAGECPVRELRIIRSVGSEMLSLEEGGHKKVCFRVKGGLSSSWNRRRTAPGRRSGWWYFVGQILPAGNPGYASPNCELGFSCPERDDLVNNLLNDPDV
jgi:hypothetical protein